MSRLVEIEQVCPSCAAPNVLTRPVCLGSDRDADLVEHFLAGALGATVCTSCEKVGDGWIPLLYDAGNFVILAVDGDRPDLTDEYHDFLNRHAEAIPADTLQRATEGSYQIIAGLTGLRTVAKAAREGTYLYQYTPGLSEAPAFDVHWLLDSAAAYRDAGFAQEAYEILDRGSRFPTSSASFWREVGAYAFSAGHAQVAEEALGRSLELQQRFRHVPVVNVPQEGVISSRPPGVGLPEFEKAVRSHFEQQRPELHLTDEETTQLAGLIIGTMERTVINLPGHTSMLRMRDLHLEKFDSWADEDERVTSADELRAAFTDARTSNRGSLEAIADAERLFRMGVALVGTDEEASAESAFRRAHATGEPGIRTAAAGRLGALLRERDPAEAERLLREATDSTDAHTVALAYFNLAGLAPGEDRKTLLQACVDCGDDAVSPRALFNLAALAHADDDTEEEERCLTGLVREDYGDVTADAAMRLGSLHFERGDYATAERLFMLADNSSDFETRIRSWLNVGVLRQARGDTEGARSLLKQVAAMSGGDKPNPLSDMADTARQVLADLDGTPAGSPDQ